MGGHTEDFPNLFEFPQDGVIYKSTTLEIVPNTDSLSMAFQIVIQQLFAKQTIARLELSPRPIFLIECAEYGTG